MTINHSYVQVPNQTVKLDTVVMTIGSELVSRQIVALGDPENGLIQSFTGTSANVNVTNTVDVNVSSIPLPTGAATLTEQQAQTIELESLNEGLVGRVIPELSSVTPLNSASSFIGAARDVSAHPSIVVSCKTDQNGILYVEFSIDGINWDSSLSYAVTANLNEPHRLTVTKKYARVRFVNSSSSNQTYFRLQTLSGNQTALCSPLNLQIQSDADTTVVRPVDFNLLVAEGLYQNRAFTVKDGLNADIDTGTVPEDITNEGGIYQGFPFAAAAAEIVVAGGDTGTVYYSYLESDTSTEYTIGSKAVTGAGTYTLGHNIWRCNYAYFVGSSATSANIGAITVRQSAPNTTVVFCVIDAGYGQTFCAGYTVPFGSSIYIDRINGNLRGTATGSIEGYFWYREYGQSPRYRFPFELQYGQLYFDDIDYVIKIPARTDLIPRVTIASANNLSPKFSWRFLKVIN